MVLALVINKLITLIQVHTTQTPILKSTVIGGGKRNAHQTELNFPYVLL